MSEIRSKRGLAYSVGSFYRGSIGYGVFGAYCMTKSASALEAARLMRGIIERIRAAGVSAEELRRAKDAIVNNLIFSVEGTREVVAQRLGFAYDGFPEDFLERFRDRVEAVPRGRPRRLRGCCAGARVAVAVGEARRCRASGIRPVTTSAESTDEGEPAREIATGIFSVDPPSSRSPPTARSRARRRGRRPPDPVLDRHRIEPLRVVDASSACTTISNRSPAGASAEDGDHVHAGASKPISSSSLGGALSAPLAAGVHHHRMPRVGLPTKHPRWVTVAFMSPLFAVAYGGTPLLHHPVGRLDPQGAENENGRAAQGQGALTDQDNVPTSNKIGFSAFRGQRVSWARAGRWRRSRQRCSRARVPAGAVVSDEFSTTRRGPGDAQRRDRHRLAPVRTSPPGPQRQRRPRLDRPRRLRGICGSPHENLQIGEAEKEAQQQLQLLWERALARGIAQPPSTARSSCARPSAG
jgi:hypothetical protein